MQQKSSSRIQIRIRKYARNRGGGMDVSCFPLKDCGNDILGTHSVWYGMAWAIEIDQDLRVVTLLREMFENTLVQQQQQQSSKS